MRCVTLFLHHTRNWFRGMIEQRSISTRIHFGAMENAEIQECDCQKHVCDEFNIGRGWQSPEFDKKIAKAWWEVVVAMAEIPRRPVRESLVGCNGEAEGWWEGLLGRSQTWTQIIFEIFQILWTFVLACLDCQMGYVCSLASITSIAPGKLRQAQLKCLKWFLIVFKPRSE